MDNHPSQTSTLCEPALHEQARARLARTPPSELLSHSVEELLYELHVYQIELERQNETLRASRLELERSRDRYMDLYEYAPVGFITLTDGGLISQINLTGAAILKLERSNMPDRRFSINVSPADRIRWSQIFTHTLQHGKHLGCELALLRGDGSWFHAQLDGLHRFEDDGATMVHVAFTDITERKQAQAREERTRRILDSTLDMIFIFSPDSLLFDYLNKGAIQGIGYSREELLQMSPLDILPQISRAEYDAFVAPLIRSEREMVRFETELLCKDGNYLSVEVRLQLVTEPNGEKRFVAIVRDVTKRRMAETELRQQKNLMWQVIDMDPSMIFVRSMTGEFILANQPVADFYGLPIKELIGSNHAELDRQTHWDFLTSDRDVIERMRELSSADHVTMRDGSRRWYQTIKRPLPQDDGSINILGIAMDITELKQSETRLAASYSELQRLSLHLENVRAEERAQIGRNLHDEMGAILAALKMRVAWLASKLPQELPKLKAEADHICDLVSDGVMAMRQTVAELRPNLLDDVGLLEAVGDYAKRFQRDTEIECTLVLPNREFPLDESQSVTIFRIIQESLNNVAKHALADSIEIRFMLHDNALVLRIQDDGIGFDASEKTDHSFGLIGIKERALMIGGEATIASAPGRGTQVKLTIPFPHQAEFDYS